MRTPPWQLGVFQKRSPGTSNLYYTCRQGPQGDAMRFLLGQTFGNLVDTESPMLDALTSKQAQSVLNISNANQRMVAKNMGCVFPPVWHSVPLPFCSLVTGCTRR